MKIQKSAYVAIDYSLTLDSGEEIDKSEPGKPLGFVFGENQIIPGLEKELDGMEEGQKAKIKVTPEEGYGAHMKELVQEFPKKNFMNQQGVEVGMVFQAHTPQGPINIRIREVKDDMVVGDMNHPLAGENLNFDVTVSQVREATQEELDEIKRQTHQCEHHTCEGCSEHHE